MVLSKQLSQVYRKHFISLLPPRPISVANLQDAMQAWNTSLPYTPERSSIMFNSSVGTTFRRRMNSSNCAVSYPVLSSVCPKIPREYRFGE